MVRHSLDAHKPPGSSPPDSQMKSQLTALPKKAQIITWMIVGFLAVEATSVMAQGNGNGNGNNNGNGGTPNPPTPSVAEVIKLTRGSSNIDIAVGGDATGNEAYVASKANEVITGSFSGSGITINSITVNSGTSLTINVTVAVDAAFGGRTLTISNPKSGSATSSGDIVFVTDVPAITAAEVMPTPPSVIHDITANVTELMNQETTYPVTYEYKTVITTPFITPLVINL